MAIEKEMMEDPLNPRLEQQLALVHNAQITTIDSFCLYVIRNHFHEIDLEPNFRIADEGELKLLKQEVMENLLGGGVWGWRRELSGIGGYLCFRQK